MSTHHRSREQQSGLPGSSHRRSEREDRLRAGSKDHDNRDRRDHGRSVGRERATSHIARHSRDRTPTRHQSSDRRQHREQDRDPRQDTSRQRDAFHTELNSRGHTKPEQNDRYQARTDPSKPFQEQLQGQHLQYHERHRDRSSKRDRTAFRPDNGSKRMADANYPPQMAAEGRRYQQHPQAAAYQSYPQATLHPPYPQAHQQFPQAQNGHGYYTHQPPNGPQAPKAWPPQRQGTPFRGGGNPFKGGGKWKHDLFEELTQPIDEAKPAATLKSSAAAAVTTPAALAGEADTTV